MTPLSAPWAKMRFGPDSVRCGRFAGLCLLTLRQLLSIKRNKINVIEVQRRKASVTRDIRYDPPHERKNHSWALYQKKRVKLFVWNVVDLEEARVFQLQNEKNAVGTLVLGSDIELGDDLVLVPLASLPSIKRDLNLNVRLNFAFNRLSRQNVFK